MVLEPVKDYNWFSYKNLKSFIETESLIDDFTSIFKKNYIEYINNTPYCEREVLGKLLNVSEKFKDKKTLFELDFNEEDGYVKIIVLK